MKPVLIMVAVGVLSGLVTGLLIGRRRTGIDAPRADDDHLRKELRAHPRLARRLRDRPPAAPLTGAALALATAGGVAVASLVGIVGLMIETDQGLARSDLPLARWARDNADGAGDLLKLVTELGASRTVLVIAVLLVFVGWRKGPRPGVAAFVATTVFGQFALSNVIKWVIDRARPDLDQLAGHAGSSFPSGHTTAAAATWACVALVLGRGRSKPVRAALAGAGVGIATAVATSRVFLGVHWFTDVVAGLALGWGWFAMCSVAFGGRQLHFGQPVERAEDLADESDPTDETKTDGTGTETEPETKTQV